MLRRVEAKSETSKPEWVVASRLTIGAGKITLALEGEKPREVALSLVPTDTLAAPSFAPDLTKLVVVDVPVRSVACMQERLAALGDKQSTAAKHLELQLLFSNLFESRFDWSLWKARIDIDKRLGLALLYGGNANWQTVLEPYAKEHATSPVVRYFTLLANQDRAKRIEGFRAIAHDAPEGLIATLARYLAFQDAVQVAYTNPSDDKLRGQALDLGAACVGESRFPLLAQQVARQAQAFGNYRPEDTNKVLAIYERAAEIGGDFALRYEATQFLANRGRWVEAAPRFETLYNEAMEVGVFPSFDNVLVTALQQVKDGDGTRFDAFARRVVSWGEETKNAEGLITFAWSAHQAGYPALAERAVRRLPDLVPSAAHDVLRAVLARLWESWGEAPRAETCVRELLRKPSLEKQAWLHEYAATLAERQGKVALAITDQERAFALEAEDLTDEVVNLAAFRQRYTRLLSLYGALAKATYVPGLAYRPLAEKILAAADRWRAVDSSNPALDTQVAQALLECGDDDDAWDVASGEIERHPVEGAGYMQVAALYANVSRLEVAAHLYEQAAALEPTDPTPLLEEAKVLERLGEPKKAHELYGKIAGAKWQDRFAGVVQQARASGGK